MGVAAVVAGTCFEGRNEIICRHVRAGMPVTLQREPSNPHDANAIRVLIAVPRLFGLLGTRRTQIGFLKARTASRLAPKMDAGTTITAVVTSLNLYDPDDPHVTLRLDW